ncbi:Flavin-containing monooxygenase FMO GS-OX-like 8, partial [Mucuna pruriens]
MMKSVDEFYHSKEMLAFQNASYTHVVEGFDYCDKYEENVGFPKLEERRKELCVLTVVNTFENLETYRDSWNDDDKLREALRNLQSLSLNILNLRPKFCSNEMRPR